MESITWQKWEDLEPWQMLQAQHRFERNRGWDAFEYRTRDREVIARRPLEGDVERYTETYGGACIAVASPLPTGQRVSEPGCAIITINRPNGGAIDSDCYIVVGTAAQVEEYRAKRQNRANIGVPESEPPFDEILHEIFAWAKDEQGAMRIAKRAGLRVLAVFCDEKPTAFAALLKKWRSQAETLKEQKKHFESSGYSSSLLQLWEVVARVLEDHSQELEQAIAAEANEGGTQ